MKRGFLVVLAVGVVAVLLGGCDLGPPKSGASADAIVAGCDPEAIKFYGAKYRTQLVFQACGINNFRFFRWSPNGRYLFFQTPAGPFVLDGETKGIDVLPVASPVDTPLWLDDTRLAFAIVPPRPEAKHRMDFFNTQTKVWSHHELDEYKNPRLLQPTGTVGEFYFVGDHGSERGRIWRFSLNNDGTITPAFEWVRGEVTTFRYAPAKDLITYSVKGGGEVVLAHGKGGKTLASFPGARRATVSSDGHWVLVEETGEPRRLDTAREKGHTAPIPKVEPQRLYLWDTQKKTRVEFPGVWGQQAEWYPGYPQVSLILQGFDERLYNPNVALINVEYLLRDERLRKHAQEKKKKP